MYENIQVKLYPFRDKSRNGCIKIDVRMKLNTEETKTKTFIVPKDSTEETNIQIRNKSGIPFDVPLNIMLEISTLVNKAVESYKNGESMMVLFKPNPTIKEFVDKHYRKMWNETQEKRNRYLLDKVLEYWKDERIQNVYSIDIEKYKIQETQEKSPATLRKYLLILRKIFILALELGFIKRNPFDNVNIPTGRVETERLPIPSNELNNVFKTIYDTDKELFMYCSLIYYTGLRPGDILNLTYDNIHIEDGIKVFKVRESKNKNRNRGTTIIPIHPDLEKIVLEENGEGFVLKIKTVRSNFILLMSKRMKRIISGYLPYQFRHTFITELSKAGVNETQINFLVGKLPEGTLKHYLKADLKILYDAICKIPSFYLHFTCSENHRSKRDLKFAV